MEVVATSLRIDRRGHMELNPESCGLMEHKYVVQTVDSSGNEFGWTVWASSASHAERLVRNHYSIYAPKVKLTIRCVDDLY